MLGKIFVVECAMNVLYIFNFDFQQFCTGILSRRGCVSHGFVLLRYQVVHRGFTTIGKVMIMMKMMEVNPAAMIVMMMVIHNTGRYPAAQCAVGLVPTG